MARPDGSPLKARVGIDTGEALVRLDIDPASGRGFLTGDAVNTAARLQVIAPPGGVVVGAATHDLTTRTIVYEELSPVAARGKSEPVQGWLAKTPISRTGGDPFDQSLTPFVGREVELTYIEALFDKAAAASSSICPHRRRARHRQVPAGPRAVRLRRLPARDDQVAPGPLPTLR